MVEKKRQPRKPMLKWHARVFVVTGPGDWQKIADFEKETAIAAHTLAGAFNAAASKVGNILEAGRGIKISICHAEDAA